AGPFGPNPCPTLPQFVFSLSGPTSWWHGPLPDPPRRVGAESRANHRRHAERSPTVEPIIGGMRGDAGLTERGRRQSQLLEERLRAERLPATQLYASTVPRAPETVRYVSRALAPQ